MRFDWDEEKRRTNLNKHGLDFREAWRIFQSHTATRLDDRYDYGEERWVTLGMLEGRVVVLVYTEPGENTIRVISLRKALTYERAEYEQGLRDRLGEGGRDDG
ncbi:MAG: BrnT family toxin [Anaerolineae bacterium]|nr:BrnT family toxin [Anaerolineae bacterium]